MGSMYRSEHMVLAQMFLQSESAYDCLAELGELGMVQFRDCNPGVNAFQRRYVNEVRRCDEMERQTRYFEKQMELEKIKVIKLGRGVEIEAPAVGELNVLEDTFLKMEQELKEINNNERRLREDFLELVELKHVLTKTQRFFDDHTEDQAAHALHVDGPHGRKASRAVAAENGSAAPAPTADSLGHLSPAGPPGGDRRIRATSVIEPALELAAELTASHERVASETDINFMGGTVLQSRVNSFERILWRACRGNVFIKWDPIDEVLEDPHTREPIQKAVFTIFFQGEQLKIRCKKICDGFRARVYPCPNTANERRETAAKVGTRIEDIRVVINESVEHRRAVLLLAAQNLVEWQQKVHKMKAIYHALNMFVWAQKKSSWMNIDVTAKCLVAECWCPVKEVDNVKDALKAGDAKSQSQLTNAPSIFNEIETTKTPPTFFRTNKFTEGFQNIVDAYGMATYREINPSVWTIISFPFLYGVMFGDIGHGFIMFLFGLLLVTQENTLKEKDWGDIFDMIFGGRYLILLMGCFAMYTGFVYNDCYSKSIHLFTTTWTMDGPDVDYGLFQEWWEKEGIGKAEANVQLNPKFAHNNHSYAYGFDPIWALADNKLLFQDSFKMKMSILLGVIQMEFGVSLSLLNHLYFKDYIRVFFEYIPSLFFLTFLFGYLCVLIVVKWLIFNVTWGTPIIFHAWSSMPVGYDGTHCAPSLLIMFINMCMLAEPEYGLLNMTTNGTLVMPLTEEPNCSINHWYPYQGYIELVLLVLAIVSIPVMLFTRPCILNCRHKAKLKERAALSGDDSSSSHDNPAYDPEAPPDYDKTNGGVSKSGASKEVEAAAKVEVKASGGGGGGGHGGEEEEEFSFGDTMIYQAIHTIEFALGCISHTASYLRLWALSLAHAQLSEVLWVMMIKIGTTIGFAIFSDLKDAIGGNAGLWVGYMFGGLILYFFVFAFTVLTTAILIMMEGLSAFLHALRLHWVEFNSKFYHGEGVPFRPFKFKNFDITTLDLELE